MSWNDLVSGISNVVMATFGAPGIYHSMLEGDIETDIHVDPSTEVMDETGHYSEQAVATLREGVVKPQSGDWIEQGDEWWHVDQRLPGETGLLKLIVRPKL